MKFVGLSLTVEIPVYLPKPQHNQEVDGDFYFFQWNVPGFREVLCHMVSRQYIAIGTVYVTYCN